MRNEYTVTKRLMKSWRKGFYFNSVSHFCVLCILCLYVIFMLYLPQLIDYIFYLCGIKGLPEITYSVEYYISHAFALFMLCFIYFMPYLSYIGQYNTYRKNYSVNRWQRVTDFTGGEIIVTDHRSVFKYQYRSITQVKEKRNRVIISLNSGTEIVVYKDAFVNGSWEECKRLISSKSSVKVK